MHSIAGSPCNGQEVQIVAAIGIGFFVWQRYLAV
jgi:hypothetical protein